MELSFDMSIVEFDSFETAFPVPPERRDAEARRFMTLFVEEQGHMQAGGTSYVCRARSVTGEPFALKRLLVGAGIPKGAVLSVEDTERITQGHAAAFYEEYRNQMLVSQMRGFPKLYGYGRIAGEPAIVMEWVNGVSLRDVGATLGAGDQTASPQVVADIGISVLKVLDTLGRLDATLVHRDLSPANIMLRTDAVSLESQMASGEFDVCLIDFGSAATGTAPGRASFTMASQVWRHGTPEYAPPEMLAQDIPHAEELRASQSIDVFALCSVLYELYAGHTPWRVADHPETTPYRLKLENAAEPLAPRTDGDEPLMRAIMGGLATEQALRPSVEELLRQLQDFRHPAGSQARAAAGDDAEDGSRAGSRAHEGSEALQGATAASARGVRRKRRRDPQVAPGLYTPDSTSFRAVGTDEGGGRAGEAVQPAQQTPGMSRRTFVLGGVALATSAVIGGGVAATLFGGRSADTGAGAAKLGGYVINESAVAGEIWSGEALYPVRNLSNSTWMLVSGLEGGGSVQRIDLDASGREPGRFTDGLIRAYDEASGGYGFKTVVGNAGGMRCAWGIGRSFPQAKDFCPLENGLAAGLSKERLAAVQDPDTQLWGYINQAGEDKLAPAYSDANEFSFGFAAVRAADGSGLWGLVNTAASWVLAPTFRSLGRMSQEGLMVALLPDDARWCFVDQDGQPAFGQSWTLVRRFTEGLAGCCDEGTGLWGFVDAQGKLAIESRFADVLPFSRNVAPAKDAATQLWGLIGTDGIWKVEPRWLRLGERTGNLFPAHGSPANTYDFDSPAWIAYRDDPANTDWDIAYGYIDDVGNWAAKPVYADTLIRDLGV
ncbi:MAG TPA: hypothetical protein DCP91_10715 [Eggerthellaceae bacterium]|nr:hypothetical protein [Eggerthellaceae bacterium]